MHMSYEDRRNKLIDAAKEILQVADSVNEILEVGLHDFNWTLDNMKDDDDDYEIRYSRKDIKENDRVGYLSKALDHMIKAIHNIMKAANNY